MTEGSDFTPIKLNDQIWQCLQYHNSEQAFKISGHMCATIKCKSLYVLGKEKLRELEQEQVV